MDKISGLSDDLLIKILSFLPTEVAVSTSILSKRWECLWMWLPKLKFYGRYGLASEENSLQRFLNRNLPLHRAPVIESFHLFLESSCFKPEDIKLWLVVALSRHLTKLKITYRYSNKPYILPSSLYTCKSLVTLKLRGRIRLDVPRRVCLPSLKILQLLIDRYLDGESLRKLLTICPVLEDLVVHFDRDTYDMGLVTVNVPSLQSLSLYVPGDTAIIFDELVIDTPCLKYFKLEDLDDGGDDGHSCLIKNMPYLEDAYVDVRYRDISSHIGSFTSVKRLTICSETVYGDGFVFNQLEHLTLCVCTDKLNLLVRLLEDSPNLRVLDIVEMDHYDSHWEYPPITVDECILSSLKTYNWSEYLGRRPQEKDLAVYVLGKRWSLEDCNNLV
ncbi:FBD-associated F-box protein At4g10400-like [Arabidopsis lyrata subsp. lyrata]|uniref:FBD-associated F-box protein At4g10400-like n=1 Tax=Arabidopsis lyrata subsp. lyrata TaxID=81972 RepID=UPI000A29C251|nr:FBD-associated F-box protein At4g10400-like [Arabidopsis lyrata subsp. lyrata]|eukprot:XP_020882481.1 FBD-associated F-box protein At4g10400-like [Arabidopsis lyrata subsp. lyrata]